MKKKIIYILILSLLIGLVNIRYVSASEIGGPVNNPFFPWFPWTINALKEIGVIYDPDSLNRPTLEDYARYYYKEHPEVNPNNDDEVTDEEISNYLQNNVTINEDNSVTYNDNSKQFLLNMASEIKENGEQYVYPFDLQTSQYPSGQGKTDLARVMGENSMCLYYYFGSNMVYCINTECVIYAVNDGTSSTNRKIVLYKHIESNGVHDVIRLNVNSEDFKYYYWSSSASGYVQGSVEDETVLASGWISTTQNAHYDNSDYCANPRYYQLGGTKIKYFDSFTDLQEYLSRIGYGKNSYYYNESVWQDFSTSSGDYTVTTDNSNHVTYGDINSYITDSYNTNGTYPSSENITNYITNHNETIINNNGGSGSSDNGSGGGDNGSGSSGSGDSGDSNIFDWIGRLGSVLGNLIKNIGDAITSLVEGLASVISGLVESVPTVFNEFIGAIFGWLPDELKALITLGITSMVLIGLIKIFRG